MNAGEKNQKSDRQAKCVAGLDQTPQQSALTKSGSIASERKKVADQTLQQTMPRATEGAAKCRDQNPAFPYLWEECKVPTIQPLSWKMNFKCSCCGALHFEAGQTGGDKYRYSNCCGKEKVAVPFRTNYSTQIKNLYLGNTRHPKELKKNIQKYNNGFAFALVQSNVEGLALKEFFRIK